MSHPIGRPKGRKNYMTTPEEHRAARRRYSREYRARNLERRRGALALDHNHQTGEFRGWLCISCNAGIGSLGDSKDGLLKAVAYLDRVSSHQ